MSGLSVPRFNHDLAVDTARVADALDRTSLAEAILGEVRRDGVAVVGVYGSWGSGKSFAMQLVVDLLEEEAPGHVPVVFHPWVYELENDLAGGLIATLLRTLEGATSAEESFRQKAADAGRRLMQTMWAVARHLSPRVEAVGQLVDVVAGAAITDGRVQDDAAPGPAVERVREQMVEFIDAYLAAVGGSHLAIFVDDLDRCSPENLVRLFEWMKVHFLGNDRLTFVIALDNVAAARAIVGRYGAYLGADTDLGYGFRYLEKLVDVEFDLVSTPSLEGMALKAIGVSRSETLSQYAASRHGVDFPGIGWLDQLMGISSLSTPRTTLKVTYRFARALDLLESTEATHLRNRLPSSYPFWVLLLVAMYFRLDPSELVAFVRRQGRVHDAFVGHEQNDLSGDGPLAEFVRFASDWSATAGESAQIPSARNLADLSALVRELRIPA